MARSLSHGQSSIDPDTRHTKEDALSEMQFERLVESTYEMKATHDIETRLILFVCGRLGLRRGELSHMRSDWIDWKERRICIPRHEPCTMGRDGDPCGHCRQMAEQQAAHDPTDPPVDELLEQRWVPKTQMAVREVPFGFASRVEIAIQQFFDQFDEWMFTGQSVNRRLNWVAEAAGVNANVYPHGLRATAATHQAGRGLDTLALQNMMGWSCTSTARDYIAHSADNLDRKLFLTHS